MIWFLPERDEVRQPEPQRGAKSKPCETRGDTFISGHGMPCPYVVTVTHAIWDDVSAVGSGHALIVLRHMWNAVVSRNSDTATVSLQAFGFILFLITFTHLG